MDIYSEEPKNPELFQLKLDLISDQVKSLDNNFHKLHLNFHGISINFFCKDKKSLSQIEMTYPVNWKSNNTSVDVDLYIEAPSEKLNEIWDDEIGPPRGSGRSI